MSILNEDIDVGLDQRFNEAFEIKHFVGAENINESIAIKKFYRLDGYTPNQGNPANLLNARLNHLVGQQYAYEFVNPNKMIDAIRTIVQMRPHTSRLSYIRHEYATHYGRYMANGNVRPSIRFVFERKGMRKKNHWYRTLEFYMQAQNDLGEIIINRSGITKEKWNHIYFDEHGNPYTES